MQRLLLLAALLIANNTALSYPQTIVHGYKTCISCHVSTDGGDTLNDYGRGMTEEFMATFAREGEASELLGLGSLDAIDLGLDYRNLRVKTNADDTSFPMYSVASLALRYHGITVFGSYGVYGRERRPETRGYWIAYQGGSTHALDLKLGYFIPVIGIGSNNHDLIIKKANGLGRETEKFVRQVQYRGPWFQVKYLMATEDLNIEGKNEDNSLTPSGQKPPWHMVEVKWQGVEHIDFGLHRRYEDGLATFEGLSLRTGYGRVYALAERDRQPVAQLQTDYARLGVYPFRGLDLWFEYQALATPQALIPSRSWGFSWMLRPRLEYEGWVTETQGQQLFFTSTKLWL